MVSSLSSPFLGKDSDTISIFMGCGLFAKVSSCCSLKISYMVQILYKSNCSKVEVVISQNNFFHFQTHMNGFSLTNIFTFLYWYRNKASKAISADCFHEKCIHICFRINIYRLLMSSVETWSHSTYDGSP